MNHQPPSIFQSIKDYNAWKNSRRMSKIDRQVITACVLGTVTWVFACVYAVALWWPN